MNFLDARLPDRFWRKAIPCPMSGCWLWVGAMCRDGYGSFTVNGHALSAHRISRIAARGPIPVGLVTDHLCRVRCCVNPAHLEVVTELVNIRRGTSPSAAHATQSACKRGHEFDERNTRVYLQRGNSRRACRACERIRSAMRRGSLELAEAG